MAYVSPGPGEVQWRKSSYSAADTSCIEVADLGGDLIGVRHSKRPDEAVIRLTRAEYRAFIAAIKRGEFDR
jgi:hypothetical protein